MLEAKKFKLGLFVSAGIALIIGMLFVHGLSESLKDKYTVYTVFDESVQGLEEGAAVKYKGVTVGRVKDIMIYKNMIRVNIETAAKRAGKDGSLISERDQLDAFNMNLKKQIQDGLVCELASAGITGMKFIELNHYKEKPELLDYQPSERENMVYIPSKRSMMDQALKGIDEIIRNFGKVDFDEMSEELTTTLGTIRKVLADPEVSGALKEAKGLFASTNKVMTTVGNALTEEDVKSIITEMKTTMKATSDLANTANEQLKKAEFDKLSSEAKETLKAINKTFEDFNTLMASMEKDIQDTVKGAKLLTTNINGTLDDSSGDLEDIKVNIIKSTTSLNETLRRIQAFFKMIEEDPATLIHGREK